MIAIIITPYEAPKRIDIDGSLAHLQELVGGLIERVQRGPRALIELSSVDIWVNEEGLLHGLPINVLASFACDYKYLVGPAVIVGANDRGLKLAKCNKILKALEARNR